MDDDASWIVLDDANEFVGPGVDFHPISRTKPSVWTSGALPHELFEELRMRSFGFRLRARNIAPPMPTIDRT
jgi:hypothetical protein